MVTAASFPRPTALFIDDDDYIRTVVRRALEPKVCTVVEAEDGETGLQLLERGVPPVDLVLVDLVLPGLTGLKVIETVSRSYPELPLLCITGFGDEAGELLETALQDYHVPVLLKPVRPLELAEAVRALLERAGRRTEKMAR
jgi:two-component system, cell cycle sensor histidine kinase and response regulator CckA